MPVAGEALRVVSVTRSQMRVSERQERADSILPAPISEPDGSLLRVSEPIGGNGSTPERPGLVWDHPMCGLEPWGSVCRASHTAHDDLCAKPVSVP
eukprot:1899687-Rhodomonas_salina.1